MSAPEGFVLVTGFRAARQPCQSNGHYEFWREGWDKPERFRLADNPLMNLSGLYYRPGSEHEKVYSDAAAGIMAQGLLVAHAQAMAKDTERRARLSEALAIEVDLQGLLAAHPLAYEVTRARVEALKALLAEDTSK